MKANAPEKIYLQENTTTDCYGEWWPEWFEARAKDTDIEYTRTDTFIEKATEWLKEHGGGYWMDDYDLPTEDLVNDFTHAMKGE